jgi:hypothetical protein
MFSLAADTGNPGLLAREAKIDRRSMRDDSRLMSWIRKNADRLLLGLVGVAVLVIAIAKDQIGLAFLGGGLLFGGVVLHRASRVRIGTEGIEAEFEKLKQEVDTLAIRTALADLLARGDQVANNLLIVQVASSISW